MPNPQAKTKIIITEIASKKTIKIKYKKTSLQDIAPQEFYKKRLKMEIFGNNEIRRTKICEYRHSFRKTKIFTFLRNWNIWNSESLSSSLHAKNRYRSQIMHDVTVFFWENLVIRAFISWKVSHLTNKRWIAGFVVNL